MSGPALGSVAIKGAMERVGLGLDAVDEVFMGNVISAGEGQAPARQAALGAGLSLSTPCTQVNKVCASGMKAVMLGAQTILAGQNEVVVAGGMESMSNAPFYLPKARFGMGYGHGQVEDALLKDGLWDVYNDQHMGNCGEKCAADFAISREEQDAFAVRSYELAALAWAEGKFASEVVPVEVAGRKGSVVVDRDEEFSRVKFEKIPSLRPAFKADGTVTAANASSLNDGASALILMSRRRAEELAITPLARIRGFGDAAQAPEDFTTAPSKAVPIALRRAGVEASDIDFHEINEAFAVVVLANMRILDLDPATVNTLGGAVALGHPIGNSGSRIITTLLNVLQQNDASLGCASICNGGGGASAIVIERL